MSEDLERVTGRKSKILQDFKGSLVKNTIILGSLQKSRYIQGLVDDKRLQVDEIDWKWESFTTSVVKDLAGGVASALILAGSNKRGAIYAAYTLSEQIGVSP